MAKKIIVANWKLNPETPREAKEIFQPVKRAAGKLKQVTTVICPPAVFLPVLANRGPSLRTLPKDGPRLVFGGQDCFGEISGAYTGKIGPAQLYYSGARYVILGHSEARATGDTNEIINYKLRLALKIGLKVILCVGEHERDENGDYLRFIKQQLEDSLKNLQRKFAPNLIIAYEPLWAIGVKATGADNPAGFQHQAIYTRKVLAGLLGREAALETPVLYGGSVDSKNAAGFLGEGGANGLLVGRASLDPEEFIKILKVTESVI